MNAARINQMKKELNDWAKGDQDEEIRKYRKKAAKLILACFRERKTELSLSFIFGILLDCIGELTSLTSLKIGTNGLKELPESI